MMPTSVAITHHFNIQPNYISLLVKNAVRNSKLQEFFVLCL